MDSSTEQLVHEVLEHIGMSMGEWKMRSVAWRVARLERLFENEQVTWSDSFTGEKWRAALRRALKRCDGVDDG
jgi:aldehyde:ferredoxin oxidoreductase